MGTKRNQMDVTFDAATQLKDAGAISATGAGTVGGQARVVNLGAAIMSGSFIVDIASFDFGTTDETYDLRLQVSSDPTFATDVTIAARVSGGLAATIGEDNFAVGRRAVPFNNIGEDGAPKAYARVYAVLAGTTPSINYQAYIGQNPLP